MARQEKPRPVAELPAILLDILCDADAEASPHERYHQMAKIIPGCKIMVPKKGNRIKLHVDTVRIQLCESLQSETLPCRSDIIMNIAAPRTNAKATRKDCKGETVQERQPSAMRN